MFDQMELDTLKNLMESVIEHHLSESETVILNEIQKAEKRLSRRTDQMEQKSDLRSARVDSTLEQMFHEINACRLEKGTLDLLLRKIEQLEQRIEELEKRSA